MRLLEMSISAGVLILLLAVLRRGDFWNLAKRTIMVLWMVVLARLLLPGSLPIRSGIAAPVLKMLRALRSLPVDPAKDAGYQAVTAAMPKAASFGMAHHAGDSLLQQAAGWLWLAGMAVACIYFAHSFWKEYRLLAQALPLENTSQIAETCQTARRLAGMHTRKKAARIFVHDRIRSPLVFGIIRQKIVIPKSLLYLKQEQMQYILMHEMVHIRRHDNLWKLLSAAAVCIHWFNPTVWLMYILSARDLELSCDEQVLSMCGSRGRQEYAMTLLTLAESQKRTTLFCSGFLENPVKERIVAIMKYKKLTGIGILCAVMLFAGASSVFATNEQTAHAQDTDGAEQGRAADAEEENRTERADALPVSYTEAKNETREDISNAEQENEAEKADNNGTAKIIVKDVDEGSVLMEVHPDAELEDGDRITVKFDAPLYGGSGWQTYYWHKDENGILHLTNEDGTELKEGSVYIQNEQDGTFDEVEDREPTDADAVNCEAEELLEDQVNIAEK